MADEPVISQEAQGSYIAQASHGGIATITVYTSPPSQDDQNRARFLVRLRTRYRELHTQSLHGTIHMILELAGDAGAVAPPIQLLYDADIQPTHSQVSTSLFQVYTDAGQELLLLGEPGAGKSTLLLELALDLVTQAERDHSLSLPVIVPLSSWANHRQPLEQWLAEQIAFLYDLPRRLVARWMQEERLLPLLDGLDEMEEEARTACITAINAYHREHLHPLVVACRKAEYEAAATNEQLALHGAVVVQPLTREQVNAYLEQCGEPLAALRIILQKNAALQELASTPLMLSILLLTYQGRVVSDLPPTDSLPVGSQQIFAQYVKHMVARKRSLDRFSPQDLISWLQWLARQMRQHNQTIFYLEHLQPDWLAPAQQHGYRWLAVRLPAVLMGILLAYFIIELFYSGVPLVDMLQYAALGGLLGWLFSSPAPEKGGPITLPTKHSRSGWWHRVARSIPASVLIGLLVGFSSGWDQENTGNVLRGYTIFAAVMGLSSFGLCMLLPVFSSRPTGRTQLWPWLNSFIQTVHGQRTCFIIVLLGASYGLSYGLRDGLSYGLNFGLSEGLSFGILSALLSLILSAHSEDVALTERLQWSWHSLMKSLLTPKHVKNALLIGGLIGLILGLSTLLSGTLSYGLSSDEMSFGLNEGLHLAPGYGLSYGLSVGLLYWILLGLFQGVSSERIEDQARLFPNQGIQRSLSNSIRLALISGVIIGLIGLLSEGLHNGLDNVLEYGPIYGLGFGLSEGLREALNVDLSSGLILAVCGGLVVWTSRGGLAVLRHYVIRLLLTRSHTFPWHGPQFLEEATARILLRRVGGGYSFPHRLLLDYFADLDHPSPSSPG